MKSKRRWMIWVLEQSAKPNVALPWTRQSRNVRAA